VGWAGDLHEVVAGVQGVFRRQKLFLVEFMLFQQLGELVEKDRGFASGEAAERLAVQAPDRFVAQAVASVDVVLEFQEQVVEEGALAASGRAGEDVDLVLLRAPLEGFHQSHEPVGEEAVGEERVICPLHKKPAAVIGDVVDGLGVVGILVGAHVDVPHDHVVENLEYVADYPCRVGNEDVQELTEGDRRPVVQLAYALVDVL
jgi:hypothetical protein